MTIEPKIVANFLSSWIFNIIVIAITIHIIWNLLIKSSINYESKKKDGNQECKEEKINNDDYNTDHLF